MSDKSRNDLLDTMVGVTRAEMDEILRLRETLGGQVWDEIQRTHWDEYNSTHNRPSPDPGVWSAFLVKLRAAARS
jgi:hypothetical protein